MRPQLESASRDLDLIDLLTKEIAKRVIVEVRRILAEEREMQRKTVPKCLFTEKEAAAYLSRSERSIRALIHERKIPVVKSGSHIHFRVVDLDAWIEQDLV